MEEEEIQNNFVDASFITHIGTKQGQFYDISLGGCSLSLTEDLCDSLGQPLKNLFFYIEVPFKNGTYPILAFITNNRQSYENPNYMVYGCAFFNIHPLCLSQLKIGVLDLEREQLRSMISIEELNSIDD